MATARFAERIGSAVKQSSSSSWYTPFMSAASRALLHRIPLVDFVLHVRDARIPLSSECEELKKLSSSSRNIVVLNKVDLAKRSLLKDWIRYFEQQNSMVFSVNSHNKVNIQEFLNFLQRQVKLLQRADPKRHTITLLLVGIPNVGKSALANALHKIGRISAAEKGKLKHVVVSPFPGETKTISSLKVASHPNIYVLDTPGILPPRITDAEVLAKLSLTGALKDSIAGEKALALYFLSVLNSFPEYQKWEKLSPHEIPVLENDNMTADKDSFETQKMVKEHFLCDHTKDPVVLDVRKSLFAAISSFRGNLHNEDDMLALIKEQFRILKKVFNLDMVSKEDSDLKIAVKLLNLYRTGRLGHYTLDSLPICVD